jgi:membrane protein DedA with SNARE-associated domain
MALTGTLAAAKGSTLAYMAAMILMGALGKTIGSFIVYFVSDKGEDIVLGKFGKLLGVTHKEVEVIGKHLNRGWRDDLILFLLRAVPIMPTAPVSIVCGIIKVNLRTYLTSTFFGVLARNIFYFYLGYTSAGALESINEGIGGLERIGSVALLALIVLVLINIYRNKRKGAGIKFLEGKASK